MKFLQIVLRSRLLASATEPDVGISKDGWVP